MDRNKTLHPRNKHNKGYSFDLLIKASPSLKSFVSLNKFGNESINFSNPRAVKELNRALLKKTTFVKTALMIEGWLRRVEVATFIRKVIFFKVVYHIFFGPIENWIHFEHAI